jgi:hypothetical protein
VFLVLWVENHYNAKLEGYEQIVNAKPFKYFDEAKEFAEDLYDSKLNPEADFVAILPCFAFFGGNTNEGN